MTASRAALSRAAAHAGRRGLRLQWGGMVPAGGWLDKKRMAHMPWSQQATASTCQMSNMT